MRQKSRWQHGDDGWKAMLRSLLSDGTASMIVYRAMQASRRRGHPALEMAFNKVNSALLGCIIGRGAEFGPGFVLAHSNGVVINGAVRGGRDIVVEHQVTIGAEGRRSPVLGDNVFIGVGAKIIGPVHVGDGAKIGANAVVVKDVEAHTTVVGVPARCVRRHGPEAAQD
ncbi:MAG: serine acetyltransferase [Polyangiaceae bacterium]|nr:serine acetyltransferase [Polyangiaceae bacterium]